MWWDRFWKSSAHDDHLEVGGRDEENYIAEAPEVRPIIQAPSSAGASSTTYGTMLSRRGREGSTPSLKIPKATALRTEPTNVSPSSMHVYTPDESHVAVDHDEQIDLLDIGTNPRLGDRFRPARHGRTRLDTDSLGSSSDEGQDTPESVHEEVPTLADDLWKKLIPWPAGGTSYFIPCDELQKVITIKAVANELRVHMLCLPDSEKLTEIEIEDKAFDIVTTAKKLYAILAYQGLSRCILDFMKDGLDDDDLPLFKKTTNLEAGSFRLETRRQQGKKLKCLSQPCGWGRSELELFSSHQWWVIAPVFKENARKVRHWELEQNHVLPFIEDEEITRKKSGFSEVWAVRIHPAHQHIYKGTNVLNPNPRLAIKRLFSTEEEVFRRETEMLKAFSHKDNPHLVRLLATYRLRGHYHLMFPLAAGDLRDYWTQVKLPEFTYETLRWSLLQCKGIASALQAIHEYKNSIPKPTPSNDLNVPSHHTTRRDTISSLSTFNSATQEPTSTEAEAKFGRHGDIKPENILWSWEDVKDKCGNPDLGTLLITDFGLMEFHRQGTRSLVPSEQIPASASYASPEYSLKAPISRKYDIWSLGCVYLEFITWLVGGAALLDTFLSERTGMNWSGEIDDDTFYSLRKDPITHEITAIIRPKVEQWIKELRFKPRNSQFLMDFLDVVADGMLKVDQDERISCSQLNSTLAAMVRKADEDPRYLTEPRPVRVVIEESGEVRARSNPSPTEGMRLPRRESGFDRMEGLKDRPMSPEVEVKVKVHGATVENE